MTNNIIIILRGHIRNSFDDDRLYDLIKKISLNYKIVISTIPFIFISILAIKHNKMQKK